MKNEIKNGSIQLKEIADLMFVLESTLRTWFKRVTAIPSKYYSYISGFQNHNFNSKINLA